MWTMTRMFASATFAMFQSLSRDSTHVDQQASAPVAATSSVSIPQSGFDPCGLEYTAEGVMEDRRFNPSVGIRPMWTAEMSRHKYKTDRVSIPQSGFDPCGRNS